MNADCLRSQSISFRLGYASLKLKLMLLSITQKSFQSSYNIIIHACLHF